MQCKSHLYFNGLALDNSRHPLPSPDIQGRPRHLPLRIHSVPVIEGQSPSRRLCTCPASRGPRSNVQVCTIAGGFVGFPRCRVSDRASLDRYLSGRVSSPERRPPIRVVVKTARFALKASKVRLVLASVTLSGYILRRSALNRPKFLRFQAALRLITSAAAFLSKTYL